MRDSVGMIPAATYGLIARPYERAARCSWKSGREEKRVAGTLVSHLLGFFVCLSFPTKHPDIEETWMISCDTNMVIFLEKILWKW